MHIATKASPRRTRGFASERDQQKRVQQLQHAERTMDQSGAFL